MHYSDGIIPYKFDNNGVLKFFLGHPGGPSNSRKDCWMLLKGGRQGNETPLECAIREFQEESGTILDKEDIEKLWLVGTVSQRKDKKVTAYAFEVDDIDCTRCFSNLVDNEKFPEMDRYAWLTIDEVRKKTIRTNVWFYEEIIRKLGIVECE